MRATWSQFVLKFIWLLGLVLLTYLTFVYEQSIKAYVSSTYNSIPLLWFWAGSMFLIGMYLALLFVRSWTFQVNLPILLCVCFPSLLLTLCAPLNDVIGSSFFFDAL